MLDRRIFEFIVNSQISPLESRNNAGSGMKRNQRDRIRSNCSKELEDITELEKDIDADNIRDLMFQGAELGLIETAGCEMRNMLSAMYRVIHDQSF